MPWFILRSSFSPFFCFLICLFLCYFSSIWQHNLHIIYILNYIITGEHYYIVMKISGRKHNKDFNEICSLEDYLKEINKPDKRTSGFRVLKMMDIYQIAIEVARGMKHLHRHKPVKQHAAKLCSFPKAWCLMLPGTLLQPRILRDFTRSARAL